MPGQPGRAGAACGEEGSTMRFTLNYPERNIEQNRLLLQPRKEEGCLLMRSTLQWDLFLALVRLKWGLQFYVYSLASRKAKF